MAKRAFDVLVIGAGPAGISAACAAAGVPSGPDRHVAVVDDNPVPGGQIWCGATGSPLARRWLERFRDAGVELLPETRAIDAPSPGVIAAESASGSIELRYDKLILATGARELFLPFPGWTLPNIMGAGGLQAFVKGGLPIAGKRVVVAGTGPLLLAVAAYLRQHGAIVPLIAEQAPRGHLARFGFTLGFGKLAQAVNLKWGIRYLTGCWPASAEGTQKIESVVLRHGGKTWREPCDYLACGFGLVPNVELAALLGCSIRNGCVEVNEWQETSLPGIYCAGEPTGIGGVELALIEGEIAGCAAAGQPERAQIALRTHRAALRFRDALTRAFALRDELKQLATPETIVCRCEDVPLGAIAPHRDWKSAKLQTRCGMGPCQGRICGPAIEFLLDWTPKSVRPPIFPARVETLAASE